MELLGDEKIWFIHLSYIPPLPLCFQRMKNNKGAEVFGGKTGSHRTGHTETYWDKFKEIIGLGYIPVEIAKDLGLLKADWMPPSVEEIDEQIRSELYSLK